MNQSKYEKSISELENENNTLQNELKKYMKKKEKYKQYKSNYMEIVRENDQIKNNQKIFEIQYQTEIQNLKLENSKLGGKDTDIKHLSEDINRYKEKIKAYETNIQEYSKELLRNKMICENQDNRLKQYEQHIDSLSYENKQLNDNINKLSKYNEEYKKRIIEYENRINKNLSNDSSLIQVSEELLKYKTNYEMLSNVKEENIKLQNDYNKIKDLLHQKELDYQSLLKDLKSIKDKIPVLENEYSNHIKQVVSEMQVNNNIIIE